MPKVGRLEVVVMMGVPFKVWDPHVTPDVGMHARCKVADAGVAAIRITSTAQHRTKRWVMPNSWALCSNYSNSHAKQRMLRLLGIAHNYNKTNLLSNHCRCFVILRKTAVLCAAA